MDFNLPKNSKFFRDGLFQESVSELSEDFRNVKSFVYIIQREFSPTNDGGKSLNLFKVGFSAVGNKREVNSAYSRLDSFRTSLLDFRVHRIYSYLNSQKTTKTNKSSYLAHDAEQVLHDEIVYNFKPTQVRLKFKNGRNTEWFHVEKKYEDDFLDFCDDAIFNKIYPHVLAGTKFFSTRIEEIKIKRDKVIVGIRQRKNGNPYRKVNARVLPKISERGGRTVQQAKTTKNRSKQKKVTQLLNKEETSKVVFNIKVWRDEFVRIVFLDKTLGIRQVVETITYKPKHWYEIHYQPYDDPDDTVTDEEFFKNAGSFHIHKIFEYFPKLMNKYKESYEFFKLDYENRMDNHF